ncbi:MULTISPECIES: hypothetical protein [unclassified Rahnella]|uniref:hypothetical protein n=1 Tax=unclassified Rahnella TaxID=2635087 RepID=UPI00101E8F79|nr:hypothetical protein [Rahnella sp. CFA14(1/10)]
MSLEFSASNILWHEFEKNNVPSPAADSEQLDKVKSFVNAFFQSHSRINEAPLRPVSRWYNADNLTFTAMLKKLVTQLEEQALVNDLDLVVLTHWTPDAEIGASVTNAIIYETGSHNAFGIAISDHGLSSAFVALQIIEDYLEDIGGDGRSRKALLMMADQDAILYDSPYLASFRPSASCCLLLLQSFAPAGVRSVPGNIIFKNYQKTALPLSGAGIYPLLSTLDMFSDTENKLPLIILTTMQLSSVLRRDENFPSIQIETWDDAFLSSAPWVLLKKLARNNTRFLFIVPEGKNMIFASFVMEG